jgi:hypothetical protein
MLLTFLVVSDQVSFSLYQIQRLKRWMRLERWPRLKQAESSVQASQKKLEKPEQSPVPGVVFVRSEVEPVCPRLPLRSPESPHTPFHQQH